MTGKKDKRSRHHSLASDAKENLMRELELQTRLVWTLSLNLNNLCSHPDFPANLPQNCMCLFGVGARSIAPTLEQLGNGPWLEVSANEVQIQVARRER